MLVVRHMVQMILVITLFSDLWRFLLSEISRLMSPKQINLIDLRFIFVDFLIYFGLLLMRVINPNIYVFQFIKNNKELVSDFIGVLQLLSQKHCL